MLESDSSDESELPTPDIRPRKLSPLERTLNLNIIPPPILDNINKPLVTPQEKVGLLSILPTRPSNVNNIKGSPLKSRLTNPLELTDLGSPINTEKTFIIENRDIRKLLKRTNYRSGEWNKIYTTKLVNIDITAVENSIINLARYQLLDWENIEEKQKIPKTLYYWKTNILKDVYVELYISANLWFLWYFDRYVDCGDIDDINELLKRRYYSIKIPLKDNCEYTYLYSIFLLLRRKSLREVCDHEIELDLQPNNVLMTLIWDKLCLPLILTYTKELMADRLPRPK